MPIYNVLIIGAGKIGAFYDSSSSQNILTHAHAFSLHKGFNLIGFVDSDLSKAQDACLMWSGTCFNSIEDAFSKNQIDVVCVAVPDEYHYAVLDKLAFYSPKLVFAEKPLTKTIEEAERILTLYQEKKIPLLVNYTRRFVPEIVEIKEKIQAGFYGEYVTGTAYYGKGITHNGSHIIDIVRLFLGEIIDFKVASFKFDFYKDDPSVSGVLKLQNKKDFFLQAVDSRIYALFEIDLIFENGRIRINDTNFQFEEFTVKNDPIFKEAFNLVKSKKITLSQGKALLFACDNIYNNLLKNENLKCSAIEALRSLDVCLSISKGLQ